MTYVNVTSRTWLRPLGAFAVCVPLFFAGAAFGEIQSKQSGSVAYVTGGVGEDEIAQMKSLARDYPVELMFTAKSVPNRFLSNVNVKIKDKSGNLVLDTQTTGPYLLAKLPPGRYTVTAEADGVTKQQVLNVSGGKTRHTMMVWNQGPVDGMVAENPESTSQ